MPPSISLDDDDVSHTPATPSKTSRHNTSATAEPATNNDSSPGAPSPDSTPVAAGKLQARSNSKKDAPTLLTDFLRGKQSPARLAAERRRRQSIEVVKAELRQEMRQSAVRRLQQPGGVKDRVQKWQKAHSSAILDGDPDDAATEPSDIAFKGEDGESVTESDRVRIKFRQKKRTPSRPKPPLERPNDEIASTEEGHDEADLARPSSPPKKRVVSDEHWRKPRRRKSPPRKESSSAGRPPMTSNGLPSDFVHRSGGNPLVANKVKQWAAKVDVSDTPPSARSHRSSKSMDASARYEMARSEAGDSASDITARWVTNKKSRQANSIRVTPSKPDKLEDDGIRVTPANLFPIVHDDGIRVRPVSEIPETKVSWAKSSRLSRSRSQTTSGSGRPGSPSGGSQVTQEPSKLSQQTNSQVHSVDDKTDDKEEPDSVLKTPTKSKGSRRQKPRTLHSELSKTTDESSRLGEEQSNLSSACNTDSDLASSLANKSVADIPADIPFGHSAFSELDLTIEGQPKSRPKRVKVDRTTSLKSMPKVFKKVVEEGKKIIHEMNEPPRQAVANNPPSIEKWLNNTVDPFVDEKPAPEQASRSKPTTEDRPRENPVQTVQPRRQGSHGTKISQPSLATTLTREEEHDREEKAVDDATIAATPDSVKEPTTPTSTGLRRSRATRSSSSPLKHSNGKRQIFGVLKEAFQGESSSHPVRPKSYQGMEQRKLSHAENIPQPLHIRKSMPPLSATESVDSIDRSGDEEPSSFKLAAPRLRPPTRGNHDLSTILSEGSSSAVDSDFSSDVTQSTLTQSTVLTKDSESSKSQTNYAPGLKRRLTKHSDLVSVLSLPDNSNIPNTIKSNRSRPSLRKNRNTSGDVTAQELLREFIDDENLYLRELKTLVDGVVPVLLSHVVNGTNATELFGPSASGKIPDNVSKSVVNMGIALEKLKSAHKKAPATDIRKMANWAHGVVPMYNSYLSAWRLGFDDVVVNLAPAADGLGDEDSLLAALPRNEKGDVVNDNGERVAVAHLLKRPLFRVKQLAKLMKCVDGLVASNDTRELLRDFESLQDKARRRFKEETARIIDEDAINTDISRCRDLGTLESLPAVTIDPGRQVSAKDVFSLSLSHSNSQRLDCQVELVHRDNQKDTNDEGDLLVRETGESCRSYLLFPPISMSNISARTGDSHFEMVVMARGTSQGKAWREFLTLTADNEDQILDWLDILPLLPVPPLENGPSTPRRAEVQDPTTPTTPTNGREPLVGSPIQPPEQSSRSPIAKDISTSTPTSALKRTLPVRYRQRAPPADQATTPVSSSPEPQSGDSDQTPTKENYRASFTDEHRGRPLKENMRPDPAQLQNKKHASPPNTMPYREDGAPPPPIHRTLSTSSPKMGEEIIKSAPSLKPPAESPSSDRLKRRTSSPLKHEYLPSDQSSASEIYSTGESDAESSDDEIESLDIPETELGVSIKSEGPATSSHNSPRFMPGSECSLTPSNSASQAGLYGYKATPNEAASRFMARISRWSDKGAWKDITSDPCAIAVTDGLIEAYAFRALSNPDNCDPPILALDLTPLVLIRQSTAVDLEIRSTVQSHSKLYQTHSGGNFRFRCFAAPDCYGLYMSVHQARLNNQKFIQLENEARFKSFGERQGPSENDGDTSSRRRSWFGRKNSYRSSVRAPSQSHDGASTTPSSTPSASSFLKRLTVNGNLSFNIARSSVDRQSRAGSGGNSLYTSGSSSASGTPPRSPSVSVENSGRHPVNLGTESTRIRLHLLVTSAKWEDYGNCSLQIRRPPPGWHQALRANHGLEKRVTVTSLPKKETEDPKIVLDAVLGSGCFSSMGSRGIVCGVWEEVKNGDGVVGMVPEKGATGGNIKKWCFQFANAAEANGVLRLVHQEVLRA